MKWLKTVLTASALSFLSAAVFSETAPLSFSGSLEADYASGFSGDNAGKALKGGLTADGKLKGSFDESSFFAEGTFEYDAVTADSIDDFSARLREAWFDYDGQWYSFRIGRQINAWGAADGLIVADVLCPQDDTAFLAEDISESRLGIDAARFSLMNDSMILDAYVIPFFTPEKIPSDSKDLMYSFVFPYQVSSIQIEKPEVSLKNMEYALRFSKYSAFMDFSLYGFYGFQDSPVFQISAVDTETASIVLAGKYKKYCMAGFASSVPAGSFVFRTEAAFFPQKYFASEDMTDTFRRNELKALAGIDWFHGSLTVTGQYYAGFIAGDIENMAEDRLTQKATLNASYSLDSANLEFSGSAVVNFKNLDSAVELEVKYDYSDSISFSLSGKLFNPGPDDDGTYGQYKNLSCIVLKGIYSF